MHGVHAAQGRVEHCMALLRSGTSSYLPLRRTEYFRNKRALMLKQFKIRLHEEFKRKALARS